MWKQIFLVVALIGVFCGCSALSSAPGRAHSPPAPPSENVEEQQLRWNAAGLLYDLLEDEKNVSKIFMFKSSNKEVVILVRLISATASADEKELTRLAKGDPGLNLLSLSLPPGEAAARKAEAKSEEYDLLFSSGANFEFNLLLTQAQAENYGSHLAKVAAKNSTLPAEAKSFGDMSTEMQHLYEETIKQMRSLPAH
jgi:hypothetical protein